MIPPHSYPVIQFLFLIFVLCTIPHFSRCPEVHVCLMEGCHVSWKVVCPLREKQWIAGGLAHVAARQLPASHHCGADDIPSDKSVKGEESTITPPSKKGEVKANEQDSGHRQCETYPSKTGRRGEAEGSESATTSYWHHCRSVSRRILKFLAHFSESKARFRLFAHLFIYLFKWWVISAAVVSISETRAEPPTSCSCQRQPA